MIINDLDIERVSVFPPEADAPRSRPFTNSPLNTACASLFLKVRITDLS